MPIYHVYIRYLDKEGTPCEQLFFNLSGEGCRKRFAVPYMKGKPIMAKAPVPISSIKELIIFESGKDFRNLILPNGKSPLDEAVELEYIVKYFRRTMVEGVSEVTSDFITHLPEVKAQSKETPLKAFGERKKVFLAHGRDDKPALHLQKYLRDKLNLDADMFEDFKEESSSNTIIEQLEYIRNNVGYAFVIATPDDVGCLKDEMEQLKNKMLLGKTTLEAENVCKLLEVAKTRSRQNVVFELGLFIGALGRDRVCCLLQKDTQDRPSDIDGILYVGFDKSVKETFPEISEKLKKLVFPQASY